MRTTSSAWWPSVERYRSPWRLGRERSEGINVWISLSPHPLIFLQCPHTLWPKLLRSQRTKNPWTQPTQIAFWDSEQGTNNYRVTLIPILYVITISVQAGNLHCPTLDLAQKVKNLPTIQETQVWSLDQEDPLEKWCGFPTTAYFHYIAYLFWASSRIPEISISASLTVPKPLAVWITTNYGKFLKRWKYQTTWLASWEICMHVKKQQLEPNMEQQAGSKLRKE